MKKIPFFAFAFLSVFAHFKIISASENVEMIYDSYYEAEADGFPKGGAKGVYVIVGSTDIFQGWKLHVSATLDSMDKIFAIATPVLKNQQAHFKYATQIGLEILSFQPQQQGKFITVYPSSLWHAQQIAAALDAALTAAINEQTIDPLNDFVNIGTDAQLGNTNGLFTRYGSFKGKLCSIVKPHCFLKESDAIDCSDSHIVKDNRISPLPDFAYDWLNEAPSPFPTLIMKWQNLTLWE